jgi:hypothetical protein
MSEEIFEFIIGQRDLNLIKKIKRNDKIIDTIYNNIPKFNSLFTKIIETVQTTNKELINESEKNGAKHVCFLINKDIFDYSKRGWKRYKNIGRDNSYDWNCLGNYFNGYTFVSPDEIEEAIIKSGKWTGDQYDLINHNCHDFIQFCMRIVGCSESMIMKNGICYNKNNI